MTVLTGRFVMALQLAFQLHSQQARKGGQIPYFAHLLGVASLVLEDNGDEDEAIAALLHDAPEDQGGLDTLEVIRKQFGDRVANIVDGCTDTYEVVKPPWRLRKEQYLAHLQTASTSVRRVSLADKLHNARTILADILSQGDHVWQRFNGGKNGCLWYYRSLVTIFHESYKSDSYQSPMVDLLDETLKRVEELSVSSKKNNTDKLIE